VERGAATPGATRNTPGEMELTLTSPISGSTVSDRVSTSQTRGRQSQLVCASSTNGNGCTSRTGSGQSQHVCTSSTNGNRRTGQTPGAQPVQFVQINLQHSKGATAVLQKTLLKAKMHSVALIQEPWVHGETIRGLKSPDRILFSVIGHGRPRAAVACSNELKPVFLPQLSSRDLAVVEISISPAGENRRHIIVASAYLPGDEALPQQQLDRLFDFCRTKKMELLVGMDANAHHTMWGSSDINTRGEEVLNLMFTWDLELLNKGNKPTFVTSRRQEVLDITISSIGLSSYITNWQINEEDSLSDHRQILFQILANKPARKYCRNPRKTKWDVYINRLSQVLPELTEALNSIEKIDQASKMITDAIMQSYHYACPKRPIGRKRQPPWWNAVTSTELEEKRANARLSLSTAMHTKAEADWETYNANKKLYKSAIRRAKRSSWQHFCQDVSSTPEMARLSKILRNKTCPQLGMIKLPNGNFTDSSEQVLVHMLDTHFPGCTVGNHVLAELRQPTVQCWREINKIVTPERVRWAIMDLEPYKSPGPDGVYPILLQKGIDKLLPVLVRLFRASLGYGYIPKSWQAVRVAFIPKPGKDNYSTSKAYRPISLSSFLLKALEKLVDRRLKEAYLPIHPLYVRQHAYQSGKSTETALHEFTLQIERALSHKEYALACFLDIEGAFNNCQFEDIREALVQRGVQPIIVDWSIAMLSQRVVTAQIYDTSCTATVNQGTAQGGVLSALFWVLVIDELLKQLNQEHFFTLGYSDDTTIILRGIDLGVLCNRMQQALRMVEAWCIRRKMSINPGKTQLMTFTRKRSLAGYYPIRLRGVDLTLTNQVKYLGVVFDPKLTFNAHIEHKCKKACIAFWQCKGAIGKTWGISPKTAHWLYSAVIRPALTYGAIVWWQAALKVSNERKLYKVQRMACLGITSAMPTAPTVALEVITGLNPLSLYIQRIAMATAYRISLYGMRPRYSDRIVGGHMQIWGYLNRVPQLNMPSDSLIPEFDFLRRFQTVIPLRANWMEGKIKDHPSAKICFTDGSKAKGESPVSGKSGAGVYSKTESFYESVPLGIYTTVFQAEVYAIKHCADKLADSPAESYIIINSDSQAAINAIQNPRTISKIVKEARNALNALARDRTVILRWIPGHSNILGNEEADTLAKAGVMQPCNKHDPNIGLAPNIGKFFINSWAETAHYVRWQAEQKCRQTKEIITKLPRNSTVRWLLSLKRKDLRLLVGILCGHCGLNRHLHVMKLANSPNCNFCGDSELSLHYLCECPKYDAIRMNTLGKAVISKREASKLPWKNIMAFILKSNRF